VALIKGIHAVTYAEREGGREGRREGGREDIDTTEKRGNNRR